MKTTVVLFNLLAVLFFIHPPGMALFLVCMLMANLGCFLGWYGDKCATEKAQQVLLSTEKLKGTAKFKRGNSL